MISERVATNYTVDLKKKKIDIERVKEDKETMFKVSLVDSNQDFLKCFSTVLVDSFHWI